MSDTRTITLELTVDKLEMIDGAARAMDRSRFEFITHAAIGLSEKILNMGRSDGGTSAACAFMPVI